MSGAWRITVAGTDADHERRAVARTPHGTWVLPGRTGAVLEVPAAAEWHLVPERLAPGSGWVPAPWQDAGSGTVRSGGLTLRLQRLDTPAAPAAPPPPAAGPLLRTSAGPGGAGTAGTGWAAGAAGPAWGRGGGAPEEGRSGVSGPVPVRSVGAGPAPVPGGRREERREEETVAPATGYLPPPIPEGWEEVPVPDWMLGPGEVRAIRPKNPGVLNGRLSAQRLQARPVRQDTEREAVLDTPAVLDAPARGRRPAPAYDGDADTAPAPEPRATPALWDAEDDAPETTGGWPGRDAPALRRTANSGPAERALRPAGPPEATRPAAADTAAPAVHRAEHGYPQG
ncbi:hypothetical protein ACIQBJ_05300 [Kitasatospora sp. NPDC088391]|uniref:hypothetical protein n=1 Tax=Kitasatospora sp. NPDC088391 TaxID=3364074 RepID=UPI003812043F